MSRQIALLGLVALSQFLGACSAPAAKLPPGVCEQNGDCAEGERCNIEKRKCEDIYYPRDKIKPY
jgi:Cys-rich repeat protein